MRRARKINVAKSIDRVWYAAFITRLLARRTEQAAPVEAKLKTPCWLWTGYCDDQGYGQVHYLGCSRWVHRVSYSLFRGVIPAGREVGHKCRVRNCFNPEHLKKVTVASNRRDITRPANEEPAPF